MAASSQGSMTIAETSTIRLFLADPHTLFREGLSALVATRPGLAIAGEASSGEEALERAPQLEPDVVLLDPEIPGHDIRGVEACRALHARLPRTPILMLTYSRDLGFILEALRAGAWGYVLKDLPFQRLASCIEHVHSQGLRIRPFLADGALDVPTVEASPEENGATLSPREREILALVAQGRANKEIGQALSISEHTVRNHISNIFGKLRARDRTEAAIQGLRRGLI